MNRLWNRLLAALMCALMVMTVPVFSLASSSLDDTGNTEGTNMDNTDLTDAEKAQWAEWADEEAAEAGANGDAALLDELEDAMAASEQPDEAAFDDLELNKALPEDVVNILLLGVDNRSEELKTGRSDAVIICSLNLTTGSVKLTSITRDTAVTIPGYKEKNRINVAFKFGSKDGDLNRGAYLAMKTVNRNFQMNISKFVLVNIHGLANIIDAMGGVDLDMNKVEANRINFELRKEPMDKVKRAKVKAVDGVQHLDGMQAVTFARIRGIKNENDFDRSERQRKLLNTLLTQVMRDIDITKLVNLIEVALPFGATNLTASDLLAYSGLVISGDAMKNLVNGASVLEQLRLPMDGTWKYGGDADKSMIAFRNDKRLAENIEAMQMFIYGQTFGQ